MEAVEEFRTSRKREKVFLVLGVAFFVIGVILAVYALIIHLESAEMLHDDPDNWERYWAEREGFHIIVRILGVFFFVLSMIHISVWFYLRGRKST